MSVIKVLKRTRARDGPDFARALMVLHPLPRQLGRRSRRDSNSYIHVVVLPRPLFPTRFYLLHPWSRALLYLLRLTAMDGGNAEGL